MSGQEGFIDLRLNHQRDQTAESFWPSFTDIMTVVVMIFMLAMLILLARNMELLKELRTTMAAERQAADLVRAKDRERVQLSNRLTSAEVDVTRLTAQLAAADQARREQDRRLAEQARRLQSVSAERDAQRESLDDQRRQAAELEARLTAAGRRIETVERDRAALQAASKAQEAKLADLMRENQGHQDEISRLSTEQANRTKRLKDLEQALRESDSRYEASQEALAAAVTARRLQSQAMERMKSEQQTSTQELDRLRADYEAKASELAAVLSKLETADRSRTELASSYSELKARYNRLVRPARTPQGRYVVEVRYTRSGARPDIRLREPTESSFHPIERGALERRLGELAKAHPEGLYVKVIFPENSGLSYTEAWQFTNALHGKYDYYYREQPQVEDEPPSDADAGR